jgi:hypothetical protein
MMDKTQAFDWLSGASDIPADGGIEQNEEMMRAAVEQQMEMARLVHSVFETPQGKELMERLYSLTQAAPLMKVSGSLVEGEVALATSDWAYLREGQNSIIRFLLAQIELAKNPPEMQQRQEGEQ